MLADEDLKRKFMQEVYPWYKNFENVDIWVENTDLGVS